MAILVGVSVGDEDLDLILSGVFLVGVLLVVGVLGGVFLVGVGGRKILESLEFQPAFGPNDRAFRMFVAMVNGQGNEDHHDG